MYRLLTKIVCLSLIACECNAIDRLSVAQTTISGGIVSTKERGCLALLSGSFGPAPFCFKFV